MKTTNTQKLTQQEELTCLREDVEYPWRYLGLGKVNVPILAHSKFESEINWSKTCA